MHVVRRTTRCRAGSGRTVTALTAAVLLARSPLAGSLRQSGPEGNRSQPPVAPSVPGHADRYSEPLHSTPTPDPVVLSPNVEDGARKVTVDTLVKVKATSGTVPQGQDDLRLHRPGRPRSRARSPRAEQGQGVPGPPPSCSSRPPRTRCRMTGQEHRRPGHAPRQHLHHPETDPGRADLPDALPAEGQQGRASACRSCSPSTSRSRTRRRSRRTCTSPRRRPRPAAGTGSPTPRSGTAEELLEAGHQGHRQGRRQRGQGRQRRLRPELDQRPTSPSADR